MKPGFRPPVIGQIFAPVPAAKSRCLSAFVAISRQNLPLSMRYEPSHLLGYAGGIFLILGFFSSSVTHFGGLMIMIGWGFIGLAILASLGQDRIVFGRSRSRLIRQLDEIRRSVGLDRAILPESLDFLETTAQQWERIEHALADQTWREREHLRLRIGGLAQQAMEDILVLECGSTTEAGLTDEQANEKLTSTAANLSRLADHVDAVSSALLGNRQDGVEANMATPSGPPQVEELEQALTVLEETSLDRAIL